MPHGKRGSHGAMCRENLDFATYLASNPTRSPFLFRGKRKDSRDFHVSGRNRRRSTDRRRWAGCRREFPVVFPGGSINRGFIILLSWLHKNYRCTVRAISGLAETDAFVFVYRIVCYNANKLLMRYYFFQLYSIIKRGIVLKNIITIFFHY